MGGHFAGIVLKTGCHFSIKKLIYGLEPKVEPDTKVIFGNGILMCPVNFHVGNGRISLKTTGKKEVTFPEIGDLFQVRIPILNGRVEKVTYFLVLSNFAVKFQYQFMNILAILYIFHHLLKDIDKNKGSTH